MERAKITFFKVVCQVFVQKCFDGLTLVPFILLKRLCLMQRKKTKN